MAKPKLIMELTPEQVRDIYPEAVDDWTTGVLDDENPDEFSSDAEVLADSVFYLGLVDERLYVFVGSKRGGYPVSGDLAYVPVDGWQEVS